MKQFIIRFLFILFLNLSVSFFNSFSIISHPPSVICYHSLYADTLVYWEPEQRLTYDSIGQVDCQVWAYDSFVHILVNYDFPLMYLRSSDNGQTWSDTTRLNIESSTHSQTLTQQDSVVYFTWSEHREGPPRGMLVDTQYLFFRKSIDCGTTLDTAIFVGKGWDVDISALRDSVFDATCYYIQTPPPIGAYLYQSFDAGTNWSGYLAIVDSASLPNIAYRNAILHFAGIRDYKIIYTRSTDLGNFWSTPTVITQPNTVLPKKPVLALGPNQNVYIAWTDNKYSGAMQFDDVLFRKSTDDGLTWGPEQRLTPDSHCDVASIDMVSQDSMIFLVWNYNGLGYPTPCSLFFLASTNCGNTWRQRETVKEGFSIATVNANVAVVQDYVYVIWRDNQYGPTDEVSMRRGSFTSVGIKERWCVSCYTINIYPNPIITDIRLQIGDRSQKISIKIFDVSGKEVIWDKERRDRETWRQGETVRLDTRDLPCGVYFVEVRAGEMITIKKAVKVK